MSNLRRTALILAAAVIAVSMLLLPSGAVAAASCSAPFPQHSDYHTCTLPSVSRTKIDRETEDYYDLWKARYVRTDKYYRKSQGVTTRYILYNQNHQTYADTKNTVAVTTSEAEGYGMIITAAMAGYEKNAQEYFDSMYRYYRRFRSTANEGTYLMAWQQSDTGRKLVCTGGRCSAADGDIDIAYALLLADMQWGSDETVDYKQAAAGIISDIYKYEVNKTTGTIQYGDWVRWSKHSGRDYTGTRSSDFITAELRAFVKEDPAHDWNRVVNKTYAVTAYMNKKYSSNRGLLPDFMYRKDGKFRPEKPYKRESALDGGYGYNACRVPWRIGTDYLVNGSASAQKETSRLNKWIRKKTGGDPAGIAAGYKLSGKKAADYSDMCFTAPFLVSAVCDTSGDAAAQKWTDALWKKITEKKTENYYNDTIKLLCMITAGGNWITP